MQMVCLTDRRYINFTDILLPPVNHRSPEQPLSQRSARRDGSGDLLPDPRRISLPFPRSNNLHQRPRQQPGNLGSGR